MTARFDCHRCDFEMCGGRNQNADHVGDARPDQRLRIREDVLDAVARSHVARLAFVHVRHRGDPSPLDSAERRQVLVLADFAASDQPDPKYLAYACRQDLR